MIEWLGFLYGLLKDIKEYAAYQESEKLIDSKYVDHLKKEHQKNGDNIEFFFSDEEKVESRKLDGWDYYYKVDSKNRKRFILKLKNGQILIARYKKIDK